MVYVVHFQCGYGLSFAGAHLCTCMSQCVHGFFVGSEQQCRQRKALGQVPVLVYQLVCCWPWFACACVL